MQWFVGYLEYLPIRLILKFFEVILTCIHSNIHIEMVWVSMLQKQKQKSYLHIWDLYKLYSFRFTILLAVIASRKLRKCNKLKKDKDHFTN